MMINHVDRWFPEEACGILAGRNETVKAVRPVTNQAHSPVRFYMEPVELLHALEWIEKQQYELIAIFHSHPEWPRIPVTNRYSRIQLSRNSSHNTVQN